MTAYFDSAEAWHAGIAAAVMAGLMFEAYDVGMKCRTAYAIVYTGGY